MVMTTAQKPVVPPQSSQRTSIPESSAIIPFDPENFTQLDGIANKLAPSNLLPDHLRGNPANVALVMMRGRELGLSPIQSLNMHVIKGKVGMPGQMMVALVKRNADCEYIRCVERNAEVATWESKRKSAKDPIRHSFTMEKAKAAGIAGDMYKKWADNMLMWRAASELCNMEWSEIFYGPMYSSEELDEIEAQETERRMPERARASVNVVPIKKPDPPPEDLSEVLKASLEQAKAKSDVIDVPSEPVADTTPVDPLTGEEKPGETQIILDLSAIGDTKGEGELLELMRKEIGPRYPAGHADREAILKAHKETLQKHRAAGAK